MLYFLKNKCKVDYFIKTTVVCLLPVEPPNWNVDVVRTSWKCKSVEKEGEKSLYYSKRGKICWVMIWINIMNIQKKKKCEPITNMHT